MASTNEIEQQKLAIVQRITESRNSVLGAKLLLNDQVASKKSALKETLNVPKRVKSAFIKQPAKSFGVALISGLGASLFLKKKAKSKREKQEQQYAKPAKQSFIASLSLAVVRPILQKLALQYSQQWLAQRAEAKFAEAQRLRER